MRGAGSEVTVAAVDGHALTSGADIALQGGIAGDAVQVADDIAFGPEAKVAGALMIHAEDLASLKVPETVAASARVKFKERKQYSESEWSKEMPMQVPVWRIVPGFPMGM